MASKMFYTQQEVLAKLNIDEQRLKQLIAEGKLREFIDGKKHLYKVEEVDKLAGVSGEDTIGTSSGILSLADTETPGEKKKGDTVITSAGISVFDADELEIEPADPLAKTQIAPAVEDQISLEGVGSGSGLLDLTRESDDTSLGAELLDEIYPSEEMSASGAGSAIREAVQEVEPVAAEEPVAMAPPVVVEQTDPSEGSFGGMLVVGILSLALSIYVAVGAIVGIKPWLVDAMTREGKLTLVWVFGGVALLLAVILALVGLAVSKQKAAREQTLARLGSGK